jgi:hypothetical protein
MAHEITDIKSRTNMIPLEKRVMEAISSQRFPLPGSGKSGVKTKNANLYKKTLPLFRLK